MKNILILFILFCSFFGQAQEIFTRKDSLRGGLSAARTSFDVLHYDLNLKINIDKKFIAGFNDINFKVVKNSKILQLDLFANMQIDSIIMDSKKQNFSREFNAFFINFDNELQKSDTKTIRIYYSGYPTIAKNAPWDGGFIFDKSASGKPWVGVACQGDGASLWFPCKDSQSDEPDFGATVNVEIPENLIAVSNGRLIENKPTINGYVQWKWEVKNPINSYNITLNIGDYVRFGENYKGLDLDFYVLRENLEKAKIQFQQVKPMMDCFQEKFGEYPFKSDSYKLVETSYLGMEHQSAVAYGNKYLNGYTGSDLSETGVGLLFDFIIIHESGHEWFGNSITSQDVADMWIHEGFTCYSESVFVECEFGKEKAQTYINGLQQNIQNDKPIIGKYGVSNEGSGDMYYKAALMLNSIRILVNNDDLWWKTIRGFAEKFRHKIINTEMVLDFFNKSLQQDLKPIFDQYLRHKNLPKLEIKQEKNCTYFKWNSDVKGFSMPIDIKYKNKLHRVTVSENWHKSKFEVKKMSEIEILNTVLFQN